MQGASRFSVLSYNVLHEFGAKRLLKGRGGGGPKSWAKDRSLQAANLVRQLNPDVACLQEVDDAAEAALRQALGEDFAVAATMRNESLPPKDGCSLLVRRDRWDVVEAHQFRMRDTVVKHFPAVEEIRSRAAGMTAAFWRELHEKLNMAVVARLRPTGASEQQEVCIATTHLFWNPLYPDLKLLQAYFLARELEAFAGSCPLILAGDLNSTPHTQTGSAFSGVYELLTQGEVAAGHPDHPVVLRPANGILSGVLPTDVPELTAAPFKSAYAEAQGAEGPVTNAAREFRGCLDYVMYRGGEARGRGASAAGGPAEGGAEGEQPQGPALRLLGVRPLPSEADLAGQLPLPSLEHPSDHLPILADFELR